MNAVKRRRNAARSTSLEDRVCGSSLSWQNADLRVPGLRAVVPRCSPSVAALSGTHGARWLAACATTTESVSCAGRIDGRLPRG
jgi:hypothetical protein